MHARNTYTGGHFSAADVNWHWQTYLLHVNQLTNKSLYTRGFVAWRLCSLMFSWTYWMCAMDSNNCLGICRNWMKIHINSFLSLLTHCTCCKRIPHSMLDTVSESHILGTLVVGQGKSGNMHTIIKWCSCGVLKDWEQPRMPLKLFKYNQSGNEASCNQL